MEKRQKHKSNFELIKILLPYYKRNAGVFFTDLFFASLTTFCDLVLPLIISGITDRASLRSGTLTLNFIFKAGLIYIVLRLVEILGRYYMQGTGHVMGARIERDLRSDMYTHLQKMPHEFFSTYKTGHIMSNLTNDLFDITEFSHHCPEEYFIGFIKLLISLLVLIRVDPILTLVLYALIPLYFYVSTHFRRRLRETQMEQRRQIGNINASIEDSFLGYSVVKSFSNEEVEQKKFQKDNSAFLKIKEKFYYALAGFQSVSRIFDGLMMAVVLVFGSLFLYYGRISSGQLIAYILYTNTLLVTLARIVEFTEQFQRGMTGLERFASVMSTKPTIVEKDNPIELKNIKGEITFDNVSFSYPGHEQIVIDKLNLQVKPGEQIAIVGPSGGGKTTISSLLPRFYDVTSGAVKIDGIDVRDVSLESLRKNIGIVEQDVYLFSDTIAANIEYGRPGASHEEIVRAAKLAGAYDFIMDLADGFDSYAGERGVMLSGGQKQRISIARVFLKNPPILILDEATSALDKHSELWIQDSLQALAKDRTTLTIAHRLSTIENADEIIVLDKGKIMERGSHKELLEKKGLYWDLYRERPAANMEFEGEDA